MSFTIASYSLLTHKERERLNVYEYLPKKLFFADSHEEDKLSAFL
jgi:hypothetical protein